MTTSLHDEFNTRIYEGRTVLDDWVPDRTIVIVKNGDLFIRRGVGNHVTLEVDGDIDMRPALMSFSYIGSYATISAKGEIRFTDAGDNADIKSSNLVAGYSIGRECKIESRRIVLRKTGPSCLLDGSEHVSCTNLGRSSLVNAPMATIFEEEGCVIRNPAIPKKGWFR